jgi:type III pantothenate kinase
MKLLLDMGNSRLKSAVLDDAGDLSQFVSTTYVDQKPIKTLQEHLDKYQGVSEVVLVSVLGKAFHELAINFFKERAIPLIWAASEQEAYGVVNNYDKPTQLGSDRFVALVAARNAFPKQNCIVIDS